MLDLGFDARGVTVSENWELDTAALRSWLRKLRGICTLPQVGHLQNQADKSNKSGGLKTMAEVLDVGHFNFSGRYTDPSLGYERTKLAKFHGRP